MITPAQHTQISRDNTCGVILAGGQSRRMGKDKALLEWQGQRLIDHSIARILPQVKKLAVSRNQPLDNNAYELPLLSDQLVDAGPLSGILTALEWACKQTNTQWLLSVAVDTPKVPSDLLARFDLAKNKQLSSSLTTLSLTKNTLANKPLTIPSSDARLLCAQYQQRLHPTCSVWHVSLAIPLRAYLEAGERRMLDFVERTPHELVNFDDCSSDPFININTSHDWQRLNA